MVAYMDGIATISNDVILPITSSFILKIVILELALYIRKLLQNVADVTFLAGILKTV